MKIQEETVYFNLETMDKERAIRLAGEKLLENGFIEEEYIESMLEKEKKNSTYIGNGISIPHGEFEAQKYVKENGLVFLHFPKGIDYDDHKVYLLIGIASLGGDQHLNTLQELAIRFSDQDFVDQLVQSKSKEEFLKHFK